MFLRRLLFIIFFATQSRCQDLHCLCGVLLSEGDDVSNARPTNEIPVEACGTFNDFKTLKNDVIQECKHNDFKSISNPICGLGICKTDGVCYKSIVRKKSKLYTTFRCVSSEHLEPRDRPLVCLASKSRQHEFNVGCCSKEDICNSNISLHLNSEAAKSGKEVENVKGNILLYTLPPALTLLLICVTALIVWHRCFRSKCDKKRNCLPLTAGSGLMGVSVTSATGQARRKDQVPLMEDSQPSTTIKEMLEETCSGSGSGMPILMQRSIAQQITMEKLVGQGSFGQVWLGRWHGENVAVKIFSTRDEKSWFRECEIYQTVMLRHENILGFIASDNKDRGISTELWLVTDYHEHGSLYDFLRINLLTPHQMVNMALSIVTGLNHLHMPIVGTKGKPAIAHRDLKSKNILVKKDLTCAIADLGLCVRHVAEEDRVDIPDNSKVGTRRYLAPEVLDESINPSQFDAWKRADIYSLGLVFWELVRRCNDGGIYEDYELPYFDFVSSDPSMEEMRAIVCEKQIRPSCPNRWQSSENLRGPLRVMKECWYANPASRLTTLRIKKTIAGLELGKII